jgi:hypothetical protein
MVKVRSGEGGTNKQVSLIVHSFTLYPCHETSCKSWVNLHFLVHRLCCWHANRPSSRAAAPRARELLCVLKIVCYLQIDSLTSSINHSFVPLQYSLFHSWQLHVLMRILTSFHLLTNLEKNCTKVQAIDLVLFVSPPFSPTPPTKANLVLLPFLLRRSTQFSGNLATLFCSWLWTR